MTPAFHLNIALLLSLMIAGASRSTCLAKPTREQIIAYAEECKVQKKRMDLVSEFGADFTGLDLSGIDFSGPHSVGFETDLRHADLSNCNLQGAHFGAAILDGANLTGANLQHAIFTTAQLQKTTLLRAIFKGTRLYQCDLFRANLNHADLSSADITGSNFGGANLADANLSGAKNEYWWSNFIHANLTRANLSGLKLDGARFNDASLRSADFSRAQLTQADFTGADLTGASFMAAHVESAIFHNATGLSGADKAALEGKAERWKFEFRDKAARFIKEMIFPSYLITVMVIMGLSISVLGMTDRPRSVILAAFLNLLALLPELTLLWMMMMGASATVQFNVGRPAAMELWSTWVTLWPLLMLLLLACLGIGVTTLSAFVVTCWWRSEWKGKALPLIYLVLTVLHCVFSLMWIGSHFPSA